MRKTGDLSAATQHLGHTLSASTRAFSTSGRFVLFCIGACLFCRGVFAHEGRRIETGEPPQRLGTVSFDISCKADVKADFNRAVALLHSFWLDEAKRTFERVAAADPDCAMSYWGQAMTEFHQILGEPSLAEVAEGVAALEKAQGARKKTRREAEYIQALRLFFNSESTDYFAKARLHSNAMRDLAKAHSNDLEAQVLYALSLLASAAPDDTELVNNKTAVTLLQALFRRHLNHPGIAHYIIHACDNPEMAALGLRAARRYAAIAPASPHALHMPAHIFARLGLWHEDIASNLASKRSSESSNGMHVGAQNRLHAIEFLQYAFLQVGEYDRAKALADEAGTIPRTDVDAAFPKYYDIVQARLVALLAMETQDWKMARELELPPGAEGSSAALILLAHAVAAGHDRDPEAGAMAAGAIDTIISKRTTPPRAGSSLATVRDEIHAWAAFSRGNTSDAVALLRPIADRQNLVGNGEMELPAREMMAEMLLIAGRPDEAFAEYEKSLKNDPNRLNGLLGAGMAAEKLHNQDSAKQYYRKLLAICETPTGSAVARLQHARDLVAKEAQASQ